MHYLLSCILVTILSAAVVYPAGAMPHGHKVDKDVLTFYPWHMQDIVLSFLI